LLVVEVDVLLFFKDRDGHASGGVAGQASRYAPLKDHGERSIGVPGLGGAEPGAAVVFGLQEFGNPDFNVLFGDLVERKVAPAG
jgi:hypothetical protein